MKSVPKRSFTVERQAITLTGDLWHDLNDLSLPKEQLPLTVAQENGVPLSLESPPTRRQPQRKTPRDLVSQRP